MDGVTSPVIVIPGITGSELQDEYELPPEAVWTTLRRRFEDVTLHPSNQRYELCEPSRIVAGGPLPPVYEELIQALRHELSDVQNAPVPVFPFGYDWRMALEATEKQLAAFVEEVIQRTLLMPHYRSNVQYRNHPTVSLVGHSMGGLIIAGYVQRCTGKRVDKVVTLGAPFQGSYEAVVKVVTGTSTFWISNSKARERKAARLTPSLYHLIPRYSRFDAKSGMVADLFKPQSWQSSVIDSIKERVSKWGVCGDELLGSMLTEAKEHRRRISGLKLGEHHDSGSSCEQVSMCNWLAIVGAGCETRVGLKIEHDDNDRVRFVLRSKERRNRWDSKQALARWETGDGVVPLAGAIPPFLDKSRLVCVTPDDFGYWELDDRAISGFVSLHASLPTMNMLHRLIARFLLGTTDQYHNTWGRRVPGVPRSRWKPPLELRDKEVPRGR